MVAGGNRRPKPGHHAPPHKPARSVPTPPPGQPPPLDYSSDPILQQIRALAAQNSAAAEAAANAARTQAEIRFGYDPALASMYGDQATADAAKGNPISTLTTLKNQHDQRQQALDQRLNAANLWYSSTREQANVNEAHNYQNAQTSAAQRLQDLLSGIDTSLAGQEQGFQNSIGQGEQDAYQRALAYGEKYGFPKAPHPAAPPRLALPRPRRSALPTLRRQPA